MLGVAACSDDGTASPTPPPVSNLAPTITAIDATTTSDSAASTIAGPVTATSTSVTTSDPVGPTPTTSSTGPVLAVVDRLVVAEVDLAFPPYVRDRFGDDWDYDPATGCNTRELVLAAESVVPPIVDDRCRPTGRWVSAYDGVATTDLAILQIDHFVPLADAWRSGASAWTDDRRRAFANDLANPETLVAVTGSTNQSKADSSPDEWLPPDRTSWCTYATDWVDVKATWSLSVTPAEKATLVQLLASC